MEHEPKERNTKSIGYKIGYGLGAVLTTCVATCIGGTAIILTVKLLMLLGGWLM